jgi:hypothetical protein
MSGCCRRNGGNNTQMRHLFSRRFNRRHRCFMPLSSPTSRRALKHSRAIQVDAYAREDGLWDLDAHITDIKTHDVTSASGTRPAGQPVHDLWLRLTIDETMTIRDVEAVSDGVPYPGHCDTIGPAYRAMIGLNLLKGLRHELKHKLGGIAGCTHLTELAQILPTAAVQAFAGSVIPVSNDAKTKPFQLDRCHALRTDGTAVAKYYPRWAVGSVDDSTP